MENMKLPVRNYGGQMSPKEQRDTVAKNTARGWMPNCVISLDQRKMVR